MIHRYLNEADDHWSVGLSSDPSRVLLELGEYPSRPRIRKISSSARTIPSTKSASL